MILVANKQSLWKETTFWQSFTHLHCFLGTLWQSLDQVVWGAGWAYWHEESYLAQLLGHTLALLGVGGVTLLEEGGWQDLLSPHVECPCTSCRRWCGTASLECPYILPYSWKEWSGIVLEEPKQVQSNLYKSKPFNTLLLLFKRGAQEMLLTRSRR